MPIGQRQSLAQLQLLLYGRAIHPELFVIQRDQRLAKGDYESHIWVTGLGHVISFHVDKLTVTQVLTDSAEALPHRGRLAAVPCRGEKEHELLHRERIRYMMNLQVEPLSRRLYDAMSAEFAQVGLRRGIMVSFPPAEAGTAAGFSYIDYEAKAEQMHVFAYHGFPDELTLVKTQSIFEVCQ